MLNPAWRTPSAILSRLQWRQQYNNFLNFNPIYTWVTTVQNGYRLIEAIKAAINLKWHSKVEHIQFQIKCHLKVESHSNSNTMSFESQKSLIKWHLKVENYSNSRELVLINIQSVRKRSLHLIDTDSAIKRWTTIYWSGNNFWNRAT
jgi:hypothetical protein